MGLKTIWMGHDGRTVDGSHDEVVVGDGGMVLRVALISLLGQSHMVKLSQNC